MRGYVMMLNSSCPRLVLGAEKGGSGKTTLSLGLLAAWRRRGLSCAAFKKGPDYIDAAWLTVAAGRPCRNLDTYLMGEEVAARSFFEHASSNGPNLIEGNRGLYDGVDATGSFSTVELAKLLTAPTVLVIDCTKRTRTAAAVALGCKMLDEEAPIVGVILNRVATARQERVTVSAVESASGLKVYGVVPKIAHPAFHERHLGLLPPQEDPHAAEAVDSAADLAEERLDVSGLWELAQTAPAPVQLINASSEKIDASAEADIEIGYFRDSAFHFYYPENLEALERQGARLTPINAMRDSSLPEGLDGLYIGGGFPEEAAALLAANTSMRKSTRRAAEAGLPIYAECGGLIYLGERLTTREGVFPMAGVFPVSFALEKKPQGHGYVEAEATEGHPFYPAGASFKGHEFHYSRPVDWNEGDHTFALWMNRGRGISDGRDGLTRKNTFATYAHTHALGEPRWAEGFAEQCRRVAGRSDAVVREIGN